MKNQISVALAIAGIALVPTISYAQSTGKPSYQSLLAKNSALQAQIHNLQAQLRNPQAVKPSGRGYAPNQPRLYEFPVAPSAKSQPLIVPRLTNIPDSRVVLLGQ